MAASAKKAKGAAAAAAAEAAVEAEAADAAAGGAGEAAAEEVPVAAEEGAGAAAAYFMYVLECADGSFYTGYTVDVDRRVEQHNAGQGAKYTRAHGPVCLLAYAQFATQHQALSAEFHFKRVPRPRKLALMKEAHTLARVEDIPVELAFAQILGECFPLTPPSPPCADAAAR